MKDNHKYDFRGSFVRLTTIIILCSICIGSIVAFFLWSLKAIIFFSFKQEILIFFLPFAGMLIYWLYEKYGRESSGGNSLILEEIESPKNGIPKLLAPLIFLTTIITHLFGGSAGREGTAVQIGGSIAQIFADRFKLNHQQIRILLVTGVAAGFGAVFGTPWAGGIFALEVIILGKVNYRWLGYSLLAAFVADFTVTVWKVGHTLYRIDELPFPQLLSREALFFILKIMVGGVCFGLAAWLFKEMVNSVKSIFNAFILKKWLIPFTGGCMVILLYLIVGKADYLRLGVDEAYAGAITISLAFKTGGADTLSWLWKTVFTVFTVGTGFKGGEVTPLFYIGATLGNTLAELMGAPVSLFAALGFIAVFAGATNTPLASSIMGAELFGFHFLLLYLLACFTAYFFSGEHGIYAVPKKVNDRTFSKDDNFIITNREYLLNKLTKYLPNFK